MQVFVRPKQLLLAGRPLAETELFLQASLTWRELILGMRSTVYLLLREYFVGHSDDVLKFGHFLLVVQIKLR